MEITPEFLIPIIIVGVVIAGLVWYIIKNRKNITPDKADSIITQLYSLAKIVYNAIKNDGKLDESETKAIFEQVKVIIAIISGKELQVVDSEFTDYIAKNDGN